MDNFNELCNENFINVLSKKGIITPTEVQVSVMSDIKNNKDMVVVAKTGSGKTLAYLIPLMSSIDVLIKTPQIVILTPTHELASQVYHVAKFLDEELKLGINPCLLIGGSNINKQLDKLKEKPRLVVGSAGRLLELNRLKKLKMHTVKTIVFDEGDRLLDDQNIEDTMAVVKTTLADRRLMYFSATIDEMTKKNIEKIMKSPVYYNVNATGTIPANIDHYYFLCEQRDKIDTVRKIVNGLDLKKVMVFVNNPKTIETIVEKLNYHKLKCIGLHGANKKIDRRIALDKFKDGSVNILVTSDLTSRGLDIPDIDCIINFDIPEQANYYQHRVGRTGRANKYGMAISVATLHELTFITKFAKIFKIKIDKKLMSYGKMVSENEIK